MGGMDSIQTIRNASWPFRHHTGQSSVVEQIPMSSGYILFSNSVTKTGKKFVP